MKLQLLSEAIGVIKRHKAIRDGKKTVVKKKKYTNKCKEGYKRDPDTGKCVRMTSEEKRNRSKSAKKAANKSSTKRKSSISNRRRKQVL